jgi:hypothetical protein
MVDESPTPAAEPVHQAPRPTGRGQCELAERVQAPSAALRTRNADTTAMAEPVPARVAASPTELISALREELAGLRLALESRAVIEQAKGVLMATAGCSADEAFELLRRQSQHENRKLRDIAAEVVAAQRRAGRA